MLKRTLKTIGMIFVFLLLFIGTLKTNCFGQTITIAKDNSIQDGILQVGNGPHDYQVVGQFDVIATGQDFVLDYIYINGWVDDSPTNTFPNGSVNNNPFQNGNLINLKLYGWTGSFWQLIATKDTVSVVPAILQTSVVIIDGISSKFRIILSTAGSVTENCRLRFEVYGSGMFGSTFWVTNDEALQSFSAQNTVDIKNENDVFSKSFYLHQNYPNPFNPTTTISYELPISGVVSVKVYNTLGQEVRTLVNNSAKMAGFHSVTWDGKDNSGKEVSSGIYLYRLQTGNTIINKKMLFVK